MSSKELTFIPEDTKKNSEDSWSILVIDDDKEVHSITKIALRSFTYLNKGVNIFSAYNEQEAIDLLSTHVFSVAFIDVVMENSDSGFRVVQHIRDTLNNPYMQLVIRTGEANTLTEHTIFQQYEINKYCEKTELTRDRLVSHLHASLKHYHQFEKLLEIQGKLSQDASLDFLTGAYNRHRMHEELERLLSHASRYDDIFSLLMFDIDFFKKINDTYGHLKGDNVLKSLVMLINEQIRDSDILIRWGGEEFIILLPRTYLDTAIDKAKTLRKKVEESDFMLDDKVTCSFSVTQYIKDDTIESLLERLDKALYRAKNNGRNRVESIKGSQSE